MDMPNTANTCGGRPSSAAICSGQVAHRADIDRTEAERFGGDQCALRSQRGVHHADDELLQIVRAFHLCLMLGRDAVQPRQIGQPHQQQRRIADELLLAGQAPPAATCAPVSCTATTLQNCRLDDVDADCAAAISNSSVPSGSRAAGTRAPSGGSGWSPAPRSTGPELAAHRHGCVGSEGRARSAAGSARALVDDTSFSRYGVKGDISFRSSPSRRDQATRQADVQQGDGR